MNVEWVEEIDIDSDLFQKFNKVFVFLEQFDNFNKKFKAILPCEVNILRNFDALKGAKEVAFNLRKYNEEDSKSREIFDIYETAIKLNFAELASLKCSKSIGWSSFSLGNIYLKVGLGSNINFSYRTLRTNETAKEKTEADVSGGFSFKLEGGFESNPNASEYIYVDGNLNISAGAKTLWPYKGDKSKVAIYFYLGNTYISVKGYIDGGWITDGRQDIPPINYMLFNSKWESEKKLIFDIKNGEVYLEDNK